PAQGAERRDLRLRAALRRRHLAPRPAPRVTKRRTALRGRSSMSADDDIVSEFLIESHENLERLEGELLELETNPTATSKLASIFRTIHTIKGTCGFLGFRKLEAVGHAGENLLSLLRDEELEYGSEIASGLLAMVDAIKEMLALIESSRTDGDSDHEELI